MAMVQRPTDVAPGTPAGDARAAVVTDLSARASERVIEAQIELGAHLMSDEWEAFMAIGESFAKDETKSTLVTTNRNFADWHEVFPNAACVVSMVDRLVHAEVIAIEGQSYRLKEAIERSEQRAVQRRPAKP